MPDLHHYLILSAVLFTIGTAGVLLRRNLITVLLSLEVMLNAVNLTFIAFGRHLQSSDGQIIVFFVITVAAAEAAVGLGLVIALFRHLETLNPDAFRQLKG
jgi:NADH-quinone oxidoreductase subunit K